MFRRMTMRSLPAMLLLISVTALHDDDSFAAFLPELVDGGADQFTCSGDDYYGAKTAGTCNSTCAKSLNGYTHAHDWCYITADRAAGNTQWCWCAEVNEPAPKIKKLSSWGESCDLNEETPCNDSPIFAYFRGPMHCTEDFEGTTRCLIDRATTHGSECMSDSECKTGEALVCRKNAESNSSKRSCLKTRSLNEGDACRDSLECNSRSRDEDLKYCWKCDRETGSCAGPAQLTCEEPYQEKHWVLKSYRTQGDMERWTDDDLLGTWNAIDNTRPRSCCAFLLVSRLSSEFRTRREAAQIGNLLNSAGSYLRRLL